MKLCVTVIALFATVAINAQIEIVQFSAEFLKDRLIAEALTIDAQKKASKKVAKKKTSKKK